LASREIPSNPSSRAFRICSTAESAGPL
jgi:hypothetical protein